MDATCFMEEACEGELQVGGQAVSLLFASHPLHLEQQVVHLGAFPADKITTIYLVKNIYWQLQLIQFLRGNESNMHWLLELHKIFISKQPQICFFSPSCS